MFLIRQKLYLTWSQSIKNIVKLGLLIVMISFPRLFKQQINYRPIEKAFKEHSSLSTELCETLNQFNHWVAKWDQRQGCINQRGGIPPANRTLCICIYVYICVYVCVYKYIYSIAIRSTACHNAWHNYPKQQQALDTCSIYCTSGCFLFCSPSLK